MLFRCAPLALVAAAACGSSPSSSPDAEVDAPGIDGPKVKCWPETTPAASGSIELGTGQPFIAMPDEVELEYGPQGGFHIPANALITSMQPGNPDDSLDPGNPRTRFRGYYTQDVPPFVAGQMMQEITCGVRIGYRPSATNGAYELAGKTGVLFAVGLPEQDIFGKVMRVEVEIIDANGVYARDEKTVTVRAPAGWPTGGGG